MCFAPTRKLGREDAPKAQLASEVQYVIRNRR